MVSSKSDAEAKKKQEEAEKARAKKFRKLENSLKKSRASMKKKNPMFEGDSEINATTTSDDGGLYMLQEVPVAKTCGWISAAGRTCAQSSILKHCERHTCSKPDCNNGKESKEQFCGGCGGVDAPKPHVQSDDTGGAGYIVVTDATNDAADGPSGLDASAYSAVGGEGKETVCASGDTTGKACGKKKHRKSDFCKNHTCDWKKCNNLKSSKVEYCDIHIGTEL